MVWVPASTQHNTRQRASNFFNIPATSNIQTTSILPINIEDNNTLFQFLPESNFDSIRPFVRKILAANRRRNNILSAESQPTVCSICKQSFQRLQLHQNNNTSPNGCFNLARLRHYICLRKNIPFTPPPEIGSLSLSDLEQVLINLN